MLSLLLITTLTNIWLIFDWWLLLFFDIADYFEMPPDYFHFISSPLSFSLLLSHYRRFLHFFRRSICLLLYFLSPAITAMLSFVAATPYYASLPCHDCRADAYCHAIDTLAITLAMLATLYAITPCHIRHAPDARCCCWCRHADAAWFSFRCFIIFIYAIYAIDITPLMMAFYYAISLYLRRHFLIYHWCHCQPFTPCHFLYFLLLFHWFSPARFDADALIAHCFRYFDMMLPFSCHGFHDTFRCYEIPFVACLMPPATSMILMPPPIFFTDLISWCRRCWAGYLNMPPDAYDAPPRAWHATPLALSPLLPRHYALRGLRLRHADADYARCRDAMMRYTDDDAPAQDTMLLIRHYCFLITTLLYWCHAIWYWCFRLLISRRLFRDAFFFRFIFIIFFCWCWLMIRYCWYWLFHWLRHDYFRLSFMPLILRFFHAISIYDYADAAFWFRAAFFSIFAAIFLLMSLPIMPLIDMMLILAVSCWYDWCWHLPYAITIAFHYAIDILLFHFFYYIEVFWYLHYADFRCICARYVIFSLRIFAEAACRWFSAASSAIALPRQLRRTPGWQAMPFSRPWLATPHRLRYASAACQLQARLQLQPSLPYAWLSFHRLISSASSPLWRDTTSVAYRLITPSPPLLLLPLLLLRYAITIRHAIADYAFFAFFRFFRHFLSFLSFLSDFFFDFLDYFLLIFSLYFDAIMPYAISLLSFISLIDFVIFWLTFHFIFFHYGYYIIDYITCWYLFIYFHYAIISIFSDSHDAIIFIFSFITLFMLTLMLRHYFITPFSFISDGFRCRFTLSFSTLRLFTAITSRYYWLFLAAIFMHIYDYHYFSIYAFHISFINIAIIDAAADAPLLFSMITLCAFIDIDFLPLSLHFAAIALFSSLISAASRLYAYWFSPYWLIDYWFLYYYADTPRAEHFSIFLWFDWFDFILFRLFSFDARFFFSLRHYFGFEAFSHAA